MSVQISVFPPWTETKKEFIKDLREHGYEVFIDSIHKDDNQWISMNSRTAYFFKISGSRVCEGLEGPDILLAPPEMDGVEKYEDWLTQILNGGYADIGLPTYSVQELKMPELNIDQGPKEYELKTEFVNGVMFYEVIKPHTDLPYTTVERRFEEKGHKRFFTNLFVCSSWGLCREDIAFLKRCWGWLEMDGEFELEQMMKEATQACNDGEAEPQVWRSSLKDVLVLFNKRDGF